MIGTGGVIAIIAGVAIFGVVAYLIVKQTTSSNEFGDLVGGALAVL